MSRPASQPNGQTNTTNPSNIDIAAIHRPVERRNPTGNRLATPGYRDETVTTTGFPAQTKPLTYIAPGRPPPPTLPDAAASKLISTCSRRPGRCAPRAAGPGRAPRAHAACGAKAPPTTRRAHPPDRHQGSTQGHEQPKAALAPTARTSRAPEPANSALPMLTGPPAPCAGGPAASRPRGCVPSGRSARRGGGPPAPRNNPQPEPHPATQQRKTPPTPRTLSPLPHTRRGRQVRARARATPCPLVPTRPARRPHRVAKATPQLTARSGRRGGAGRRATCKFGIKPLGQSAPAPSRSDWQRNDSTRGEGRLRQDRPVHQR